MRNYGAANPYNDPDREEINHPTRLNLHLRLQLPRVASDGLPTAIAIEEEVRRRGTWTGYGLTVSRDGQGMVRVEGEGGGPYRTDIRDGVVSVAIAIRHAVRAGRA